MSTDTLLVILLVWSVAEIMAAIAFGKAIRIIETAPQKAEPLPAAAGNVRYFRRNRRKTSTARVAVARMRNGTMKQATG